MRTSSFALQIILCMTFLAPAAQAQEISPPDREQRKGMSYEEYAKLREKMRSQMEKAHANQSPDKNGSSQDQAGQPPHNSTYGQGYRSRNMEDRHDSAGDSKPERPQRAERFDRGGMMRR